MTEQLKPLTEAETTELLDWVSACQSSYHIDSTPGHRFGGLGSHLQENRDALVEYVNALIAARAQPAQAVLPVLTEREIEDMYDAVKGKGWSLDFARAIEKVVRAKMGVGVGWIAVADHMPPPDTWLLVAWGAGAVDKAHTFTRWKHPTNPLGYLIQGHPGSHNDVTHWMKLPESPNGTN